MNKSSIKLEELRCIIFQSDKVLYRKIEMYEKFLFLIKKHPKFPAVPTKEIDCVWHYHINHPELYVKDCKTIFGHTIIHKESKTVEEKMSLKNLFEQTNLYWRSLYGCKLGNEFDMAACGVDGDGGDNGNDYNN